MTKGDQQNPYNPNSKIEQVRTIFPNCVTESRDENGDLNLAIDLDQLAQELGASAIDTRRERYQLTWPGKREAFQNTFAPIEKTLRPEFENSIDFFSTKNLFIEGDNLDALKLLQEIYLGTIKMIYIDPPYNTGKDFIYKDSFAQATAEYQINSGQTDENNNRLVANPERNGRFHSDWLSMMYPRLRIARNLLSETGVIVVHIDEHEYVNLEKLLSEIFGEQNNLGTIVWDKRNPKGDAIGVAQQHEYICIYCKNRVEFKEKVVFLRPKENAEKILAKARSLISRSDSVTDAVRKEFKSWIRNQNFSGGEKSYCHIDDNGNVYRPVSMAWPNRKNPAPEDYRLPLIHPSTNKECPVPSQGWRNSRATMERLLKDGHILFGPDETTQPQRKYLLLDNMFENVPSLLYYGGSDDALFESLNLEFDNPKPLCVARKLIESICSKDDIVFDFFAGSSTTAHAVMELNASDGGNRRFFMVQLAEPCDEDSQEYAAGFDNIARLSSERIRRAGKLFVDKDSCHENWNKDVGFRYLKIDSTSMRKNISLTASELASTDLLQLVDNIKEDRSSFDLLFQVLIDWSIDLTLEIENRRVLDKDVFVVDENMLIACFEVGITERLVEELAILKPHRVVFQDAGFSSDSVKFNVDQIFRQLSPVTKVISI